VFTNAWEIRIYSLTSRITFYDFSTNSTWVAWVLEAAKKALGMEKHMPVFCLMFCVLCFYFTDARMTFIDEITSWKSDWKDYHEIRQIGGS